MSTERAEDESSPLSQPTAGAIMYPKEENPNQEVNEGDLELSGMRTEGGESDVEVQEVLKSIKEDQYHEERETEQTEMGDSQKVPVHRRVSIMLNSKAETALNLDEDLERLGFENPVDNYSTFAAGIVQITRALHCIPYRDLKEWDEDYSRINLLFLKLYHGKWHRKIIYWCLAWLAIVPLLNFLIDWDQVNQVDPPTDGKEIVSKEIVLKEWAQFVPWFDGFSLVYVYFDIFVKVMSYGKLVWVPSWHREVISTYVMFICAVLTTIQIFSYGNSVACTYSQYMGMGIWSSLWRSPMARSIIFLARSNNLQNDLLSKMYSLRKAASIFIFSQAVFIFVCLIMTVAIGVLVSPDLKSDFFKTRSNVTVMSADVVPVEELVFDPDNPKTQYLTDLWKDEMDSSFETIFHTWMTLFSATTFENYFKIGVFLWENNYDSPIQDLIPRVVATLFILFFGLFMFCMDCIVVAVCVQGFAEHRSKMAESTMLNEIRSLESAYDYICSSGNTVNISKDMWMCILLATGKKFGKSDEDYRISSILIFEMIDLDQSSTLEKQEFVDACVKGFLGKVKKKPLRVQGGVKHRSFFSDATWEKMSIFFDTVGGNAIWLVWSIVQFCFLWSFSDALVKSVTDSIQNAQDTTTQKIFNTTYKNATKPEWKPLPNLNITTCSAEFFAEQFDEEFKLEYEDSLESYVFWDTLFLILALLEVFLRALTYRRRSIMYPAFQKKMLPKMEVVDCTIVFGILVIVICDSIFNAANEDSQVQTRGLRTMMAVRGLRIMRLGPAAVRFRSTDHNLLYHGQISGRKLNNKSWFSKLFDFKTRLDMNYDVHNNHTKSSKGPLMRIGNTFVHCFIFSVRQVLLISIVLYIFASFGQALFSWVPCTLFGDYPGDDDMVKDHLPFKCEKNEIDYGFLNVNVAFEDFARTFGMFLWCFFSRNPQEVFNYIIQLSDLDKYDQDDGKRSVGKTVIFTFFYCFYTVMILFIYNFVTAEIMQICDLLRFNMLHQVEVVFLKPKKSEFFYAVEWTLNMTSQRGGMIIEYYSKKLAQAIGGGTLDSAEGYVQDDDFENLSIRSTHYAVQKSFDKKDSGEEYAEENSEDEEDDKETFLRGSEAVTLGGNEHLGSKTSRLTDDGKKNPVASKPRAAANKSGGKTMSSRASSSRASSSRASSIHSRRASLNSRNRGSITRDGKGSSLDMLSNLVRQRNLPSGEVLVDPKTQRNTKREKQKFQKNRRLSNLGDVPEHDV
ncbi:hypothetical protein TrST_g13219 [Triparma strigata]|uniref:EF-hand domain-containing protein n=1 Tax=Triparma strigata TaxID=1606541 RepID=A0A9W7B5W6_9STRA|nr:hypothetical protein TrST_g13219 [Triparma strigata]